MIVYVNWETQDIISEEDFEDKIDAKVEQAKKEFDSGNIPEIFYDWLDESYDAIAVFDICREPDGFDMLKNEFFEDCRNAFLNENGGYVAYTI